jgi:hypothetical protein
MNAAASPRWAARDEDDAHEANVVIDSIVDVVVTRYHTIRRWRGRGEDLIPLLPLSLSLLLFLSLSLSLGTL